MAAKVKKYVLKRGLKHQYKNDEGEVVNVVGDGKKTIPLTDAQFENFRDKLVVKDEPEIEEELDTEDAKEATETGKPKDGASPGASGASTGKPNQAAGTK